MITIAKFQELQALFFTKVGDARNPTSLTFDIIGTAATDDHRSFTGDGVRSVTSSWVLKCFFKINPTDKEREKAGVSQETTLLAYVSPLELKNKSGSMNFPVAVRRAYANCRVLFNGEHYEVLQIRDLEMMLVGKEYICLAYQISLGKDTGNIDFN